MPSSFPRVRGRPALGAMVAIAVSLMLVQCDRADPAPPEPAQTEAPRPASPPTTDLAPALTVPLTRGDLISAAGQAASAFAQGVTPAEPDTLVGRSFAIRVSFGCGGPALAQDDAPPGFAHWTWGPDQRTIRIQLTPADWTQSALITGPGPQTDRPTWEASEGFWVPRPWLAAENCPKLEGYSDPIAPGAVSPQTLGLAAVFDAGGSRSGRRNGKAYEFTVRASGDQPLRAPTEGYRLLLEGRVVGFPGGRAMRCRAAGPDQRPVCIAAVQLDKVAFEEVSGATLVEWRPAS